MREVKFRAWNKRDKKMLGWDIVQNQYFYTIEQYPDYKVMQYTGLKDKNEKEIYEGDILKVPVDINQEVHGSYSIHEVIIKKGIIITSYLKSEKGQILPKGYTAGFLLDSYDFDNKTFLFSDNPTMDTKVELLGNIYENPELLEGIE
jgi:uncharacterized phage protein (TIGR01671 family)